MYEILSQNDFTKVFLCFRAVFFTSTSDTENYTDTLQPSENQKKHSYKD